MNPNLSPMARRYRLLDGIRSFSRESTRKCRRTRISPTVQIQRRPDGGVAIAGVHTCGGVRDCPVCAAKIYAERGSEVSQALRLWRNERDRNRSYMLTLTIKHGAEMPLRRLRKGLANAWRLFWQGRAAQELRERLGLRYYVRALEVTRGNNGWHPHLHIVLFTTRELDEFHEDEIATRWQDSVLRALGQDNCPDKAHGCKLSSEFSDEYITKLGLEIGSISTKIGKGASRTPWQIAQDAADNDLVSQKLWREYCTEMRGARQLTWSRGCRRFFGLGAERDDDELASDGVPVVDEGVGHVLAEFEGPTWDKFAWRRGFVSSVVEAATSELPMTALSSFSCSRICPRGRVFSEAVRESPGPRMTDPSSFEPNNNVTREYGARVAPPDHVPSSAMTETIL